jgi:PAS domain S-box-containing protein
MITPLPEHFQALVDLTHAEIGHELIALLDAAPVCTGLLDGDLRVVWASKAWSAFSPQEVQGMTVDELMQPGTSEGALSVLRGILAVGGTCRLDRVSIRSPVEPLTFCITARRVRSADGLGLLIVATDLSEQTVTHQRLQEHQEKLRLAIAASGMGLWTWSTTSPEIQWDRRMQDLHGVPQTPTSFKQSLELVHKEDQARLRNALHGSVEGDGRLPSMTYRVVRPDGSIRWVMTQGQVVRDARGTVVSMVGGSIDVTDQRRVEERQRQSQRLEALGKLTAGIAHNFNNMLMAILPNVELAEPMLPPEERWLLQDAREAARRAADMIKQLMTFAGTRKGNAINTMGARELLERMHGFCRPNIPRHILLTVQSPRVEHYFSADSVQIEQVLVNLIINARDAIIEAGREPGHIQLGASLVQELPDAPPASGEPRTPWVCISVQDDGTGMKEDVRTHIFEPFFTTKRVGEGTGLGLATSFAIVREHDGWIHCQSAPGEGTTFRIYLPMVEAESPTEEISSGPLARQPRTGARVLVVDDEPWVRRSVRGILRGQHHKVMDAADGREALQLFEQGHIFDLILLDRNLPWIPGENLVERFRDQLVGVPIVLFTGDDVDDAQLSHVDGIIRKPIQAAELLELVGMLLSGGEAGTSLLG